MEKLSSLSYKFLVSLLVLNLIIIFLERNSLNIADFILIALSFLTFIFMAKSASIQSGTIFLISCLGFVFSINLHHSFSQNSGFFVCYFLFNLFLFYQIHYPQGTGYLFFSMFGNVLKIAVPVIFAIFVFISFFPKVSINLLSRFSDDIDFQSDLDLNLDMNPGEISKLGLSKQIFFTASSKPFVKNYSSLYWRGTSLDKTSDGLHWYHPDESRLIFDADIEDKGTDKISQNIILNKTDNRILFGLDTPIKISQNQAIPGKFYYQMISSPNPIRGELSPELIRFYLQMPKIKDQRILNLAKSIQRNHPKDTASELMKFFSNGFQYSLEPGKIKKDSLAKFLFEKRVGFCEHYAASFASLMRLAGVPSRVVIGFQGGGLNPFNQNYVVRGQDAHAWAEVWSSTENTWLRYDPVEVVAPKRIQLGAATYFVKEETRLFKNFKDKFSLLINALVTELSLIYLGKVWSYSAILPLILLLVFGLIFIILRRTYNKNQNKAKKIYQKFNKIMTKKGLKRLDHQGPLAFGEQCQMQFPEQALLIQRFIQIYIELSYSNQRPSPNKLREMRLILREF